jgi:hypothetical protein
MTNTESQTAFRERKYAAGYKQIRLWVPRDSEGTDVKAIRAAFAARFEELTAGWSKTRLTRVVKTFMEVIKKEAKKK